MSITINQPLPTTGRLLKSTLVAAAIAGALLVTAVLPAEYGIRRKHRRRPGYADVLDSIGRSDHLGGKGCGCVRGEQGAIA